MADRLISPLRRRVVEKAIIGSKGAAQLMALGWDDYDGPATAIRSDQHIALNGWIVFGTDSDVDQERRERTGTFALSTERTVRG